MTDEKKANLAIYDAVKKTDPQYTKAYSLGGGDSGTSVSGQYYIMRATELFGPMGIGWGTEIIKDEFIDGAPFIAKTAPDTVVYAKNHTIYMRLWYKQGEEKGEVFQYGHTKYLYSTKSGSIMCDSEYGKKSFTDALKKCLVQLGFTSDIYMGLHDDRNYVDAMNAEFAIENAIDQSKETAEQIAKFDKEMENNARLMGTATNLNELENLFRISYATANTRGSEKWKDSLKATYDEKKSTFNK